MSPDQFTNQLMGPSRAKGRIVMGGVQQKQQRQKMMRPLFQQVEVVLQIISPSTSTPSKRWSVSVSCLMGKWWGMLLASFLYYQPNKVKSGQYQQNNTYNRLIEPVDATSAASSMTNLLNMLSSKNIKQKLGKTAAQSQENSGGVKW